MRFSDHILELSGIGHPDVPKRIGVPLKVELPGIGENVQDHMFACKSSSKHFLNEILWRWPIGIFVLYSVNFIKLQSVDVSH